MATGQGTSLDAAGSFDPEGEPLTYRWQLQVVPPGSGLAVGSDLGAQPSVTLTPDASGLYAVNLWVADPGGLWSMPAQVVVWAE